MVQDSELSPAKAKRSWRKLLWGLKLIVTILIFSYIYSTFNTQQKGISDVSAVFAQILDLSHGSVLALMLLLVPLNWALESQKWKILASKVVKINFWDAFRGTLTGLAIGVAAPAQLGDSIGRIAALRSDKRLEAIGAAFVSNGIQFYVSVLAGLAGWFYTKDRLSMDDRQQFFLTSFLFLICVSGIAVALLRKKIISWYPSNQYLAKVASYLRVIGTYSTADLLSATGYGALRYLVFTTQFVLALSLFDFNLRFWELSACVTLIFLAKTLIPAINVLGDLGLREFTALFVFSPFNLPPEQVIAATFLVWIINVLGPILIGIVLIWKYKWRSIIP